jgi:hypothetical protein
MKRFLLLAAVAALVTPANAQNAGQVSRAAGGASCTVMFATMPSPQTT